MMKITSVQEGILSWSKNVKGWPTANISQCPRSLIKFQELLIRKLDRFLFRTTENDTVITVFLPNCVKRNKACGVEWCIWTSVDEGVFLFPFGWRQFPYQNSYSAHDMIVAFVRISSRSRAKQYFLYKLKWIVLSLHAESKPKQIYSQ